MGHGEGGSMDTPYPETFKAACRTESLKMQQAERVKTETQTQEVHSIFNHPYSFKNHVAVLAFLGSFNPFLSINVMNI